MSFNCMPQRISKFFLAVVFSILGMGAVVIGLTILPFIGLFLALPIFAIAFYFYKVHLADSCSISK